MQHTSRILKTTAIIVSVLLLLSVFLLSGCQDTATEIPDNTDDQEYTNIKYDGDFSFEEKSGEITITGYEGTDTVIAIPAAINNIPVSAIGNGAFEFRTDITSVTIPDTVKSLGERAFNECTHLTEIFLPAGLESIDKDAFFCCTRLKDIELPENLSEIGDGAFYNCISLESISVPGSVTSLGEYSLAECHSLKNAELGEGIENISNSLFMGDSKLEKVILPSTITSLGKKAFYCCKALDELQIPESVTEIGEEAFFYCPASNDIKVNVSDITSHSFDFANFASITFLNDVSCIHNQAFANSNSQKVIFEGKVDNIEEGAFYLSGISELSFSDKTTEYIFENNSLYTKDYSTLLLALGNSGEETLEEYTVDSRVSKIAEGAFNAFPAIKVMNIPDNVKEIGVNAFAGINSIDKLNLPATLTEIKENMLANIHSSSLTLPEGITKIDAYAFENSEFKEIGIPASVTEIELFAFQGLNSLSDLKIASENKSYKTEDQVLTSADGKTLIFYPGGLSNETFSVPKGIETIGQNAFSANTIIQKVVLPESVTTIEDNAFMTTQLKELTIPANTSEIGQEAFGYSDPEQRNETAVIYGTAGSEAEKYATENDIGFFTGTPEQNITEVTLNQDETAEFTISNTGSNGVIYSSSDDRIAQIDDKGVITGISKGETSVIATKGNTNFICHVTVTSGNRPESPYDNYILLTKDTYKDFEQKYYAANPDITFETTKEKYIDPVDRKERKEAYDFPCLSVYTGNNYKIIKALVAGDTDGAAQIAATENQDIRPFETIAYNIQDELHCTVLPDNYIFFSGTSDVKEFTGKSNSLADMKSCIGSDITSKTLTSTALDHAVSENFNTGYYSTMLEFYLPKNFTSGTYAADISRTQFEFEYLMSNGLKMTVLDAGVREYSCKGFSEESEEHTVIERYMKILLD